MNSKLKKLFALTLSVATVMSYSVIPMTAKADSLADPQALKSWKFDFGATKSNDSSWTQIDKDSVYTDAVGYGFLGQDEATCNTSAVVDGYTQSTDNITPLENGSSATETDSVLGDYVFTQEENMPIRFALKVENNTYYRVKVTMGNSDKDSKITLTSERRHFVLTEEEIKAGDTLTKEFTVAVHTVKWKDRPNDTQPIYADDLLNVAVLGENAMINAIEIQQIEKPKVMWVFGDSTVCDGATSVPAFKYNTYAGWGISLAKYLPDDVAVVNLAEGGLSSWDEVYFNLGKDDITAGDLVTVQLGHNDDGTPDETYKKNMLKYYDAAVSKGASYVFISPLERLSGYSNGKWNPTAITDRFQPMVTQMAQEKNAPLIDLTAQTTAFNNEKGSVVPWYTHTALWQGTAASPKAQRDGSHLNDYGADIVASMYMDSLAELAKTYPELSAFVRNDRSQPVYPDEAFMKNGTSSYVTPPHSQYPYPAASIDYDNMVDITKIITNIVDGKNYLQGYSTVRHTDGLYLTGFAAVYTADGLLDSLQVNRFEPSPAKSIEGVSFITDDAPNGIAIPEGAEVKVYVWEGGLSDGSMTFVPMSDVVAPYNTETEYFDDKFNGSAGTAVSAPWVLSSTAPDSAVYGTDEDGTTFAKMQSSGAKDYYFYRPLTTPQTSGKIKMSFDLRINSGKSNIYMLTDNDGKVVNDAFKLSINGDTGAVSLGADAEIIMDGLKTGKWYTFDYIYDIDYGQLTVIIDGIGKAVRTIDGAITVDGINPSQIAGLGFLGKANAFDYDVTNVNIQKLSTEPLPQKTLTIKINDETIGSVEAPTGAIKNEEVTIKAIPKPDENHNYVFAGWFLPDGTMFKKDAETSFRLIDDLELEARFYEQLGLEGLADYDITSDNQMITVPASGSPANTATLSLENCTDQYGNPIAAIQPSDITWALKAPVAGASLTGNKLEITSDYNLAKEESEQLVITATCNNITKEYTILVNAYTNMLYYEDFEQGTIGSPVPGWEVSKNYIGRYTTNYTGDENNQYLGLLPANSNNGATITGTLLEKQTDGLVQVEMDILSVKPGNASDPTRRSTLSLTDANNKAIVSIQRNQSVTDYIINGHSLEQFPQDTEWAKLTAIMNFVTKTADIKLTSLDGTTVYYNAENVPFADDEASGFNKIYFDTNRYYSATSLDNIIINQIGTTDEIKNAELDQTALTFINQVGETQTVNVTVPDGWMLSNAYSLDDAVATAAYDSEAKTVSVTAVQEGETSVNITICGNDNPKLKATVTLPVSVTVSPVDDATLLSLNAIANTEKELVANEFISETTDYFVKADGSITSVTINAVPKNDVAKADITSDTAAIEGNVATLISGENIITVTVTAADNITTKDYVIHIDNTYNIAEDFSSITGDWGFTGSNKAQINALNTPNVNGLTEGTLQLLTMNNSGDKKLFDVTKTLDDSISAAATVQLDFDWQSNVASGNGRDSYFALQDTAGNLILALYGNGKNGIKYTTTEIGSYTDLESFSNSWYSVSLTLDFANKKMNGTITNKTTDTVVKTFTDETILGDNLGKLYAYDLYSAATMSLDNVYVKVTE